MNRNINISRLVALCWLLLVVSSSAVQADQLRGRVVGEDGEPLAGLRLQVHDRQAVSGDRGEFSFEELPRGPALMQIIGDEGTGQLRVRVTDDAESIQVVYPVVNRVVILHDNDLHFNFHHRDLFERKVERYRAEYADVFLMNAGDIFVRHRHRWPVDDEAYYAERSRWIIETMNRVGYDVAVLGNHETDTHGDLTRTSLELARFPLLAANWEDSEGRLPHFRPYVIRETHNGLRLAVLGLTAGGADPLETAREYARLAEENHLLVALTHIGVQPDRRLAEQVDFIDVIVGGHTHTFLETAERINGTLVAQAGGHSHYPERERHKFLGVIHLKLVNGELVESSGQVHVITGDTD